MNYPAILSGIKPSIALVVVTKKDSSGKDTTSFGSGFIYQEPNKLATCNHLFQDATKVQIKFSGSTNLVDATIFKKDEIHDLAILIFTPEDLRVPLKLTTTTVQEGQPVLFCGFPIFGTTFMAHQGMISAIETDALGNTVYAVDGSNNKGNSGGPLLDESGGVVGVMSNKVHNDGDQLLVKVSQLQSGAVSIFGTDLVLVLQRFIDNIQLGVGVARPAFYLNAIVS